MITTIISLRMCKILRILVLSDSHGAYRDIEVALERCNDVKKVFFLGDGASQVDEIKQFYPDKEFYIVSGNCDILSRFPSYGEAQLCGVKIIYTHGHKYGVKYGTEQLYETARNTGASLVLYGHTHIARCEYKDGIYFINPGAIRNAREGRNGFCVIDITPSGIMPSFLNI